jgi:uncharacterized caspase-like protein
MAKGALIVGINAYEQCSPLYGCENDARAMEHLLATNHDDSPNFQFRTLLSSEVRITRAELRSQTEKLFTTKGLDVALFYFAGHGAVTKAGAFLMSQDAAEHDEGMLMAELVSKANESPAQEKIIILDCCHAGAIDQLFASTNAMSLGNGVSILAACRDTEQSAEKNRRGLFTSKLCDALDGGAADVRGFVNMAGCYTYLDEVLFSVWEQRPVFKANVEKLVPLRRAEPAVSDDKLRKLPVYFPTDDHVIALDPSFEPTAEPNHPENEAIFGDLQRFRGARLVVPNGTEHMYYAAMQSQSCQLTPLGKFYWHKAAKGAL